MIVYQKSPGNLLLQFPLRLHAPFSHGQSKVPFPHLKMRRQIHRRFLRLRGHLYSLYAEPGRTAGLQRFFFFRSVSVLEENSRQSLSIIPLEIFSFPPVKSEKRWLYQWKLHSLYLTEIKVT